MHIVLSQHIQRPCTQSISPVVAKAFPNAKISIVNVNGMFSNTYIERGDSDWMNGEILLATMGSAACLHPKMPLLKLLQTSSAGLDGLTEPRYMLDHVPTWRLCRNGNPECFGIAMSQYCIAWILYKFKNFDMCLANQPMKQWNDVKCSQMKLTDQSVIAILGCGQIGKMVANALKSALHCQKIIGINRNLPPTNETDSCDVDEFCTINDLDIVLPKLDVLIAILPSNDETIGLLDNDRLAKCNPEKKTLFINIGRGDLISEESILKAVRSKWIDTAILDVFPVEPLPENSALWNEPKVIVTPHVAYASSKERLSNKIAELLIENIKRLEKDDQLLYEVDLQKHYEKSLTKNEHI